MTDEEFIRDVHKKEYTMDDKIKDHKLMQSVGKMHPWYYGEPPFEEYAWDILKKLREKTQL